MEDVLLAIAVFAFGSLLIAIGVYRLRNPSWLTAGWGSRHRRLAALLIKSGRIPFTKGRTLFGRDADESLDAAIQLVGGAIVLICGLLLVMSDQ